MATAWVAIMVTANKSNPIRITVLQYAAMCCGATVATTASSINAELVKRLKERFERTGEKVPVAKRCQGQLLPLLATRSQGRCP